MGTECNTDRGEDIQRLTCKFATGAKKAFFQLRFTDQFGGEYDTRPIKVDIEGLTAAQNANSVAGWRQLQRVQHLLQPWNLRSKYRPMQLLRWFLRSGVRPRQYLHINVKSIYSFGPN